MKKSFAYIFLIVSTLLSCSKKVEEPKKEEAPGPNTIKLTASANSYLVGEDDHSISFTSIVLDKGGFALNGQNVIYQVNGKDISGNQFKPDTEGLYKIKARVGTVESNEVEINAINAASQVEGLMLTLKNAGGTHYLLNGGSVELETKVIGKSGNYLPFTKQIKLAVNNTPMAGQKFVADKGAGFFGIKASGYGRESNTLVIQVRPDQTYSLVKIPIIFHTINNDLSEADVQFLVDGLNKAYRNQYNPHNMPKDPNAADFFIEFTRAEKDPQGNKLPVAGVHKVVNDKKIMTRNNGEDAKDAWNYYWDPNFYLNVWVYNFEDNSSTAFGPTLRSTHILKDYGWRHTWDKPDYTYGVFFNAKHTKNIPIIAHEIGHMLGLYHLPDRGNVTACTDDPDFCNDTPNYNRSVYSGLNRVSCEGVSFTGTNIMDHSPHHENSFTYDQRTRARHVIDYGIWLPTPANQTGKNVRDKMVAPVAPNRDVKKFTCPY